jgi:replicative DNA helicase
MFASLEMGLTLATDRLVRIIEGWQKADIRRELLTGGSPAEALALSASRFALFSKTRQSLEAIESAINGWERTHDRKIRALVIDYFQYLRGEQGESPYERGSRLSRELKELAKARSLVIVNLCQVKRGVEGGKGTECPSLEAARDSGTIEENADVVLGMWQPKVGHEVAFKGLKVREGSAGRQAILLHDVETGRMFTHYHKLEDDE